MPTTDGANRGKFSAHMRQPAKPVRVLMTAELAITPEQLSSISIKRKPPSTGSFVRALLFALVASCLISQND